LRGARPARGHARDGEPAEQVEKGRQQSLLGKAADKDDIADQVVTMCRTNTMTGQTLVIDSGRTFH
jgi:3-oxoacyl-[acyl-carrier protein] reductase